MKILRAVLLGIAAAVLMAGCVGIYLFERFGRVEKESPVERAYVIEPVILRLQAFNSACQKYQSTHRRGFPVALADLAPRHVPSMTSKQGVGRPDLSYKAAKLSGAPSENGKARSMRTRSFGTFTLIAGYQPARSRSYERE
jgi:hypothetical protein